MRHTPRPARRPTRLAAFAAGAVVVVGSAAASGCVGSGEIPARISGQLVGVDEEPLGPGMIMIEAGPVHDGAYILGGHVDDDGQFSVELPGAGTYGLHLFVDGYQYLPAQIEVQEHQQIVLTNMMIAWGVWMDLSGQHSWPTQPDDASLTRMPPDETDVDNPVLHDLSIAWDGDELIRMTAEVSDPDGDLSRMVLAFDETTGAGYAFNAPGPPVDGNYPQGIWTLNVFADDLHVPGESRWRFVVSDKMCNDTDILFVTLPERSR